MELVRKEDLLFPHTEDGKALPEEVEVKELGGKVKVLPVLPNEWGALAEKAQSMAESNEDFDGMIIKKQVVEPKLAEEEIKFLKPQAKAAIAKAVLRVSGFPVESVEALQGGAKKEEAKSKNPV